MYIRMGNTIRTRDSALAMRVITHNSKGISIRLAFTGAREDLFWFVFWHGVLNDAYSPIAHRIHLICFISIKSLLFYFAAAAAALYFSLSLCLSRPLTP
jgi:hypothetical protein